MQHVIVPLALRSKSKMSILTEAEVAERLSRVPDPLAGKRPTPKPE